MKKIFTNKELIPKNWHIIPPWSLQDLGRENLFEIIKDWKKEKNEVNNQIFQLKEIIPELEEIIKKGFNTVSQKYENPKISTTTKIGIFRKLKVPTDEKSKQRKIGATSYNLCGWCKHASSNNGLHNGYIEASCRILKSLFPLICFDCDQKCLLNDYTNYDFINLKFDKEIEMKKLLFQKKFIEKRIKILKEIMEKAETKPILPDKRNFSNHFKKGDIVFCNMTDIEQIQIKGWIKGTISEEFLGRVKVEFQNRKEIQKGEGLNCSAKSKRILHEWEYLYLINNPDFFKDYFNGGD